jgi:hypothetical protein
MKPVYRRVNEEKQMNGLVRCVALGVSVLAVTGCKPSEGRNEPREVAGGRAMPYQVYEATPALTEQGRYIEVDGRRWIAYDAPSRLYGANHGAAIPQRLLRPVGSGPGVQLYVLESDQPPYARLYSPLGTDRWREYRPASF